MQIESNPRLTDSHIQHRSGGDLGKLDNAIPPTLEEKNRTNFCPLTTDFFSHVYPLKMNTVRAV